MGKKKMANKLPATTGEKRSDDRATVEARPPSPQPSQPAPTPPILVMVPLDALVAYLMQQDSNRDWAATLAGFNQPGGMTAIPIPTPEIPATIRPPTTIPTSSNLTSKKSSPTETAPSASSNLSPIHQQIDPFDVIPLSAYQDPYLGEIEENEGEKEENEGEEEEKEGKEEEKEGRGNESEETPVADPLTQEKERKEIDLNETVREQGLMTDDEFQSFLDGVDRTEIDTGEMAEGLDLASQPVKEAEEK